MDHDDQLARIEAKIDYLTACQAQMTRLLNIYAQMQAPACTPELRDKLFEELERARALRLRDPAGQ
jgi:hypothetical protein